MSMCHHNCSTFSPTNSTCPCATINFQHFSRPSLHVHVPPSFQHFTEKNRPKINEKYNHCDSNSAYHNIVKFHAHVRIYTSLASAIIHLTHACICACSFVARLAWSFRFRSFVARVRDASASSACASCVCVMPAPSIAEQARARLLARAPLEPPRTWGLVTSPWPLPRLAITPADWAAIGHWWPLPPCERYPATHPQHPSQEPAAVIPISPWSHATPGERHLDSAAWPGRAYGSQSCCLQ